MQARPDLLEVEAVRNVVSSHETSQQMCDGSGLTTVRPEQECVHSSLSKEQTINKYYISQKTRVLRGSGFPVIIKYLKRTIKILRQCYSPAKLVENSNVGIHVVDVIGVGGVLDNVPLLWLGALGGEHVATVLGLIVHTVKTCHLHIGRKMVNGTGALR